MLDNDGNTLAGYRPGLASTAPTSCRNGHVRTAANTYRSTSGHERCRDCRRRHKPLKGRPCAQCKAIFSGKRGSLCPDCAGERRATVLEESTKPVQTRACADCGEVQPLDRFRLPLSAAELQQRGVSQYSARCQDCREEDDVATSPYERAKQQIVRIFGIPAREWINRPGHVLADLHFVRMLAIQHAEARRVDAKLVRADIDTRSRLLWPRLREFLHRPSTVRPPLHFQLMRAA